MLSAHEILNKIAKIEALIERGASEGERQAAQLAKERILAKVANQKDQVPIEYSVSANSPWKKRLFVALCGKHGLRTYRYHRQKYTTTQLRITKAMMSEVLWPEYLHWSKVLEELIEEVLRDVIIKIHKDEQEEVLVMGELGSGVFDS